MSTNDLAKQTKFEDYLSNYGVTVAAVHLDVTGKFYMLSKCVIDGSHANGAAIVLKNDGSLDYLCKHPDCSNKTWADVEQALGIKNSLSPSVGLINPPKPSLIANYRQFPLTDLGNAERLIAEHGDNIRYVPNNGKWYIWDSRIWRLDIFDAIYLLAKDTVRRILQTTLWGDKEILFHALNSESLPRLKAMIELASKESNVGMLPDMFDTDDWLLNCENGTINLKTGELLPHDRANYITRVIPVKYDRKATCPLFKEFLYRVMDKRPALIAFLQRAIGYALTGMTKEECIFFLYGIGANGKSTLLEIVRRILGDYSRQTEISTFLERKSDAVRNDIAMLNGTRFVTAVEADEGKYLAEAMVKQMTGQDRITARFLYGEYFEYTPTFKIFVATNYKPVIRGTDEGIWRRIMLIPFSVTIPKEERDHNLKEKLINEMPGILNWAIQGCLEWQRIGLAAPEEVMDATSEYREEMDILAEFLESDWVVLDPQRKALSRELYNCYCLWCSTNNAHPISINNFGRKLRARGLVNYKAGGKNWWEGIVLSKDRNKAESSPAYYDPNYMKDAFKKVEIFQSRNNENTGSK